MLRRMLLVATTALATIAMIGCGDDGGPSNAATSLAPTASATASATTDTPTAPRPPQASVDDVMAVGGPMWIDGRRPGDVEAVATINGVECGRAQSLLLLHSDFSGITLDVASSARTPGCGTPGDPVIITLNGRPINTIVPWQPGDALADFSPEVPPILAVGAPIAEFRGVLHFEESYPLGMEVIPLVDGDTCGEMLSSTVQGRGPEWHYYVVVDAEDLAAGCAKEGDTVSFVLRIDGLDEIDLGTEVWSPWASIERSPIDLTGRLIVEPTQVP